MAADGWTCACDRHRAPRFLPMVTPHRLQAHHTPGADTKRVKARSLCSPQDLTLPFHTSRPAPSSRGARLHFRAATCSPWRKHGRAEDPRRPLGASVPAAFWCVWPDLTTIHAGTGAGPSPGFSQRNRPCLPPGCTFLWVTGCPPGPLPEWASSQGTSRGRSVCARHRL